MKPVDRARLTAALRDQVGKVTDDLRAKMRANGSVRERARKLYVDEQVGEDFEVWSDLLARRAAVLWLLKSVYVRVLEDRGLLSPGRILDIEAQQLFERLAPNLGETAFLRWVYRDLASPKGGLPELFGQQPAEVATPSDELSRELLSFWRHRDPDSGAHWSFAEEPFEGELMGDLYQELDPVVKERFALCQTPDFVRAFILDRTLTPAIETFGADEVRLIDPACGSGHFLIDGLKRLVASTAQMHADWDKKRLVAHCLERVVGIDLNDYACALARARLVMTAAELAGVSTLAEAAQFHPHVYWADGLEQVEKGTDTRGKQLDLLDPRKNEAPRASLTRPEVRAALREVLERRFHAVVANPPYILESDGARKEYHREKVGRTQRYVSAYKQYHLSSPFTERAFQLATADGLVGLIIDNQFMKRDYGRPLIEHVLAGVTLTLVVDTAQAHIPFHGTSTVLIFGRRRTPDESTYVRAVMGKRGETGAPDDPSRGRVWVSILEGWETPGFENEFVSVVDLPRSTLASYPWSLQGGGANNVKRKLENGAAKRLSDLSGDVGRTNVCGQDPVFMLSPDAAVRHRVDTLLRPLTIGEVVRDWNIGSSGYVLYPYSELGGEPIPSTHPAVTSYFWPYRTLLRGRSVFGKSPEERGSAWYEHLEHYIQRLRSPMSIGFAFVSTHNQFAFDRTGRLFNRSAPVIKLPPGSTEDEYLHLLGILNSSTLGFWMRQVFYVKGGESTGKKRQSEPWSRRLEYDATKIQAAPLPREEASRITDLARRIDHLASEAASYTPASVLASEWRVDQLQSCLESGATRFRSIRNALVAWQEELDWTVYTAFGLASHEELIPLEGIEPIASEHRPFAIRLARAAAEGEATRYWFEAMGVEPTTQVPQEYNTATRQRIERRLALLDEDDTVSLLEAPEYKRKWEPIAFEEDLKEAAFSWLTDRVEHSLRHRTKPVPLSHLAGAVQDDPRFLAVASIYQERRDVDVTGLVAQVLGAETVPNHPFHIYTESGLAKRGAWENVWELQRREDAGEKIGEMPVPPEYSQGSRGKSTDFLKNEYWKLRGKVDVPKERFIAFTEVPGKNGSDTLHGWAGWTPAQRLRALLAIDEDLEDGGVPVADRVGVLDSAWRLLPDVARDDSAAANRLKAELQALVGSDGPSREMLDYWCKRFPPPGARGSRGRQKR